MSHFVSIIVLNFHIFALCIPFNLLLEISLQAFKVSEWKATMDLAFNSHMSMCLSSNLDGTFPKRSLLCFSTFSII